MPKTLRLILGDQLNSQHHWFANIDPSITYILIEAKREATYVRHHIQKIMAFFLAMRRFADNIKAKGHQVRYIQLKDNPHHSITAYLNEMIRKEAYEHFEYQLPDEYRLDQALLEMCHNLPITTKSYDTAHFLTERNEVKRFFEGKKTYLMESFYREMRKKYNLLMQGDKPIGDSWNYDAKNRKKYDKKIPIPPPLRYERNREGLQQIHREIIAAEIPTIGNPFPFEHVLERSEALELLAYFNDKLLPYFGHFQDAMEPDEPYLFHSRLSFALNTKMISPLEVVKAAIKAWKQNSNCIDLAQIEGFVRQIIGWREYMRGVYWAKMPKYETENFFAHERKLPNWYWTADTKMHCLSQTIKQSLEKAYAHHIQRLMITGNFALLAGIHPDEVDTWYLGIYIDAIQWVEITNTRGMSQFADGGLLASKPYTSSANYIQKMSRYCTECAYNPKIKVGNNACPFNSLYWHFHHRHNEKLAKNPRIGMVYRNWERMSAQQKSEILKQAEDYLQQIENL
ncbi:MAG: cryptochrome/photolyase family protein [Bernardetiaceae bacterium]|nr:cryptochrome/photolyase family protein [Bernardetiaceae bacterium]